MKIFLGSDHNGYDLRTKLADFLRRSGFDVVDEGDQKPDPQDDFPVFASRVISAMKTSDDDDPRGLLICGSGQGMCMAANRHRGIRAALCWNVIEARSSRNDDNSNVLCLSATSTTIKEAEPIVMTWLSTPFAGATRFKRRLSQLDDLA